MIETFEEFAEGTDARSDRTMKFKTVARFREASEAHLAKGALAVEGIDAEVLDEHLVGVNWLYSDAVGGVKLAVAPDDVASATLILRPLREGLDDLAETMPRLRPHQVTGILTLLAMASLLIPSLIVGIPLFFRRRRPRRRTQSE